MITPRSVSLNKNRGQHSSVERHRQLSEDNDPTALTGTRDLAPLEEIPPPQSHDGSISPANSVKKGIHTRVSSPEPNPIPTYNQVTPEEVVVKSESDEDYISAFPFMYLNIDLHDTTLSRLTSDTWCNEEDFHFDTLVVATILGQDKISATGEIISGMTPSANGISQPYPSSSPPSFSTPPPTPSLTQSHRGVINVLTITDEDVLLGRGGLTNMHRGNQYYRAYVERLKPNYCSTENKAEKKKISTLVVEHIEQRGGRFLKNIGENGRDKWVVAERRVVREKASQALREKGKPKTHN